MLVATAYFGEVMWQPCGDEKMQGWEIVWGNKDALSIYRCEQSSKLVFSSDNLINTLFHNFYSLLTLTCPSDTSTTCPSDTHCLSDTHCPSDTYCLSDTFLLLSIRHCQLTLFTFICDEVHNSPFYGLCGHVCRRHCGDSLYGARNRVRNSL